MKKLDLRDAHLNREDVESLSEAVRAGKLPQLEELNLISSDLSNMEDEVEALIAACDAHCEKWVLLNLYGSGLSGEFIQRCRNEYRNVLTTYVSTSLYILRDNKIHSQDLFGILRQSNSSVETIVLKYADLNKAEIRRLLKAIKAGKLPQLKELELFDTLTGHLNDLFGGPNHPGFPSLEKLDLSEAHLNREDVESLV